METVTQIDLVMPNVPNSLSRIGDKLRAAEVNIDAIACTEGKPNSVVHLIVSDVETAKAALREIGKVSTTQVMVFRMKNRPGAIGAIGRAVGASGGNIRNMYATTWGKDATVYVSVDDTEKTRSGMQAWKDDGGSI